jgi:hypothetical protein
VVRAPLLKLREDLSRAVGDCRAEWRAYEREVGPVLSAHQVY